MSEAHLGRETRTLNEQRQDHLGRYRHEDGRRALKNYVLPREKHSAPDS